MYNTSDLSNLNSRPAPLFLDVLLPARSLLTSAFVGRGSLGLTYANVVHNFCLFVIGLCFSGRGGWFCVIWRCCCGLEHGGVQKY